MSADSGFLHRSRRVPGLRRLTRAQFGGVIALLIGVSQFLVGAHVLEGLSRFVVSMGSGLLLLIGSNLVRNRTAFHNGWNNDGEHGWVFLLILTSFTATVLVAAGLVLTT